MTASETKNNAMHLLVVDDDVRLAELLQRYLNREGFEVSVAHNTLEARILLAHFRFSAMILDIRMPNEDGISLTKSLRNEGQEIPILLLSAEGEVETRVRGLELGADDYLTKPFETAELKARLHAIMRRSKAPEDTETTLVFGELRYDVKRHILTLNDEVRSLSGKEQALLDIFAASPHQILRRDSLYVACGDKGGERTIDTLVSRLRRKIEPTEGPVRFLQTVHGHGYVLRPDQIITS